MAAEGVSSHGMYRAMSKSASEFLVSHATSKCVHTVCVSMSTGIVQKIYLNLHTLLLKELHGVLSTYVVIFSEIFLFIRYSLLLEGVNLPVLGESEKVYIPSYRYKFQLEHFL